MKRCEVETRSGRCTAEVFAVVSTDEAEYDGEYCIEHLASDITGWITEYGSVTVREAKDRT